MCSQHGLFWAEMVHRLAEIRLHGSVKFTLYKYLEVPKSTISAAGSGNFHCLVQIQKCALDDIQS